MATRRDDAQHEPEDILEPEVDVEPGLEAGSEADSEYPSSIAATPDDAGMRLDNFLVSHLPDVSRARVQQLIDQGVVMVNERTAKSSLKLKGTEQIDIIGNVRLQPLRAIPEDIPLDVVFEDNDLAVVNKPAGMTVHASNGSLDDPRNRGTLVNALLFRFKKLSEVGGELRPGIVHRLDKDTSGLIVVAKNDVSHRKLAEQFSSRKIDKRYLALVHGWPNPPTGTVDDPVQRDRRNPARMTTQGSGGREAVSHYKVVERFESPYGRFALVEVKIDTGRTHQIRVHMSSIGHPVVGDTMYGAPAVLSFHTLMREKTGTAISSRTEGKKAKARAGSGKTLSLGRNFLHAASIEFHHPRTGKALAFRVDLPAELRDFYTKVKGT